MMTMVSSWVPLLSGRHSKDEPYIQLLCNVCWALVRDRDVKYWWRLYCFCMDRGSGENETARRQDESPSQQQRCQNGQPSASSEQQRFTPTHCWLLFPCFVMCFVLHENNMCRFLLYRWLIKYTGAVAHPQLWNRAMLSRLHLVIGEGKTKIDCRPHAK